MSMILERFGATLQLPILEATQDIGTAGSRSGLLVLPMGGAFDVYGTDRAPRTSRVISIDGAIVGTPSERQAQVDALRALRGKRDKLYARMDGDGNVRWTWARVLGLPIERTGNHINHVDVSLNLELQHPVWYGEEHTDGWVLDTGEILDDGLVLDDAGFLFTLTGGGAANNLTVTNGGNADVTDLVLTITAPGGSTVTDLTINVLPNDASWHAALEYNAGIGATKSLVINAGRQSIHNDTSPDYANLEFGIAHTLSGWLRLGPGNNSVQVSYTGSNGATLLVTFNDHWE